MNKTPRRWAATTSLNENLLRASFIPLLEAYPDLELLFVSDQDGAPMERVRYIVPKRLAKIIGRLPARFISLLWIMKSVERIEVFNAVPHMLLAALPARLFGKPMDLHMFAGRYELDFAHAPQISDNRIIRRLKHPIRLERYVRNTALKRCSRFFVPGKRTREYLESLNVPPHRIVNLHSTIDTIKYQPGDAPRDIDVIIVAGMRTVKRPFLTLEILEKILAARPDSRFIWLGGGELEQDVRRQVNHSPLGNALKIVGHVDDVAPYYRRAKIFLLNSSSEGLSCAAMEGMACGVVPVTADVGDMAEIVRPSETGNLIEKHGDSTTYVRAILALLENTGELQRLSTNCRELIVREHSFEAVKKIWKTLDSQQGEKPTTLPAS